MIILTLLAWFVNCGEVEHPPGRQRGGQEAAQGQEARRGRREEGARRYPEAHRRLHAEDRSGRQEQGKRDPGDPVGSKAAQVCVGRLSFARDYSKNAIL